MEIDTLMEKDPVSILGKQNLPFWVGAVCLDL